MTKKLLMVYGSSAKEYLDNVAKNSLIIFDRLDDIDAYMVHLSLSNITHKILMDTLNEYADKDKWSFDSYTKDKKQK